MKRRRFVAHYIQPVIQQYESTTVCKKNFYNQNGSQHMPTTKSTLFVVSKDEWDTKEGTGEFMKNALHVRWYGKRHLLG